MKHKQILFLSILFLFLTNDLKSQVQSSTGKNFDVNQFENESIQFLTLKAIENNGNLEIILLESKVVPGRLKKKMDISLRHHSSYPSHFTCTVLDESEQNKQSGDFPHPLIQFIEYEDEETDQLTQKEIILKEQEFLIRIPYDPQSTYLKLEEVKSGIDKNEISLIQIN